MLWWAVVEVEHVGFVDFRSLKRYDSGTNVCIRAFCICRPAVFIRVLGVIITKHHGYDLHCGPAQAALSMRHPIPFTSSEWIHRTKE